MKSKKVLKTLNLDNRIENTLKNELEAVSALKKELPNIKKAINLISKRSGKIMVIGVGKSAFVGMKISATLTSLGYQSFFMHPVDALHGDLGAVSDGDVVIAISYSGESLEVLKILKYLKKTFDIKIISITGKIKSSIANISNCHIEISVKEEGSAFNLAPMSSTTASLVAGDLLASGLTHNNFQPQTFAKFHPGGSLGFKLKKVSDVMVRGSKIPLINSKVSLKVAIKEIDKKKRGIVGITDNKNQLTGVITDGDIRRFFTLNHSHKGVLAKDIMTVNPKTVSSIESLSDALFIMEKWRITTLFVVDKNHKPVGFVHMHDIIQESFM